MGRKYRRMEDQKPGPSLACTLDFAKGKELNQKVKRFPNVYNLGDVMTGEQISLTQTYYKRELFRAFLKPFE